ncbi:uncharacterized protein LOC132560475 [Ylistrum balloti]|uniref:uncharacterized protein LOC132560475 n=1 Tax=Ylistrum balloti TaxID=509963 RepID=UPI002905816D|nr:uncharacterized protein LOC132560475 [Ylistrum balloti]
MNLKMEVQIPSRAFFEIFRVKLKETENFLNVLKHRCEREKALSAVLQDYQTKSVAIFQEGKSISSHLRVFNVPLMEEMREPVDRRNKVSSSFTNEDNPICLLQEWIDKNGNEGPALLRLAKKTVKKYEALVTRLKVERKVIYKKIEELDLNMTCQGKYGGSLQRLEKTESSTARKKRFQLEQEEDKLRSSLEKSFLAYKELISEEIQSRRNFLQTMSTIREQCSTLESRRLNTVAKAYNRYISILEESEPLNSKRRVIMNEMKAMASEMADGQISQFKQWTREKTRYYIFELVTDNWTPYGLGIVTNNVPDIVIPANLQVLSESDKTDSSLEEQSGKPHEADPTIPVAYNPCDDFRHIEISDQSTRTNKHGFEQQENQQKSLSHHLMEGKESAGPGWGQGAIPKTYQGSMARSPIRSPDGNEDTPVMVHPTNRRVVKPNPTMRNPPNPPPKSSTDGWRATQTPIGSLTLPTKGNDQAKKRGELHSNTDTRPSPVDETETASKEKQDGTESHLSRKYQSKKDTPQVVSKEAANQPQWHTITGKDDPYYTPGDPSDLEVMVLPEGDTQRPERPFQPMINNWMDPDMQPLEPNSSDHNLLSQFLNKTKSKFRRSKKAKKSTSPDIIDSGPVPFDFGCEDVDEVSTVIDPAYKRTTKGGPAKTPSLPGSVQPSEKSKPVASSGSDSSDNENREAVSRRPSVKTIKMCSIDFYEAKHDDEISFLSGQTVKMIHPANSEGMAYGYTRSSRLKKRQYGYFPINHVVRVLEDKHRTLRRKVSGFFKKR